LQIKTKIVSSQTADSKTVKQEINGAVILPPLVFPAIYLRLSFSYFERSSLSLAQSLLLPFFLFNVVNSSLKHMIIKNGNSGWQTIMMVRQLATY